MTVSITKEKIKRARDIFDTSSKPTIWVARCGNGHQLIGPFAFADLCCFCSAPIGEAKLWTLKKLLEEI